MKHIYFLRPIGQRGPIKIGSSEVPVRRLQSYQIWSPVELELAAVLPAHHNTENFLHRHFLASWTHGEWFNWSPEIQGLIDHINDTDSLPEWVTPPTCPSEYRAFLEAYPRGKSKRFARNPARSAA